LWTFWPPNKPIKVTNGFRERRMPSGNPCTTSKTTTMTTS